MTARRIVWFSCGAASAVLARLAVDAYGADCEVVYCDTMASEHEDNARFFADVEGWIGRSISVIKSTEYVSVDDVIERRRYMAGPRGAACTSLMKKSPREAMQRIDDVHLFGYTAEESKRADDFEDRNPALRVEWLLIDRGIAKAQCHAMIAAAGIAEPAMYAPAVFERRCRQSRALGVRLVRLHGVRIFLDDLPEAADAPQDNIDCGPVCQIPIDFGAQH